VATILVQKSTFQATPSPFYAFCKLFLSFNTHLAFLPVLICTRVMERQSIVSLFLAVLGLSRPATAAVQGVFAHYMVSILRHSSDSDLPVADWWHLR
jgi:hypothetical protein